MDDREKWRERVRDIRAGGTTWWWWWWWYSCIDTATDWKKPHFILSYRLYLQVINKLSLASNALTRCMLTSNAVDEILFPWHVNWSIHFRGLSHGLDGLVLFKTWFLFYMHSHTGQCYLMTDQGFAVRILHGLSYLWEALGHLRSLHQS